jgi:branched-chain amino acid transport system permease protein
MSTEELVQQSINGLALGSSYALLALGLAMVFSIMGLINFAHGELLTIGGYTMWVAFEHGVPWPLVIPITLLSTSVAAVLMERVAFRPLREASLVTLLITSFAVSYFLQTVFQIGINTQPEGIELPGWVNDVANVGSYSIPIVKLVTAGVTFVALIALTIFLRRSMLGISMRAAAEDFAVARLMGVRANGVVVAAFAVSGLLAGLAALLFFAQTAAVDPTTGTAPVVKAFIAVILGGLGSLSGAVAGGFVLGFAEVIFQATLPDGVLEFRDAFVLSLLIALLLFRPGGLLGRAHGYS